MRQRCCQGVQAAPLLVLLAAMVVGFFSCGTIGEPVCGELASNQKVFQIGGFSRSNSILGQRFEVTSAVMVSNFSASLSIGSKNATTATLYADASGSPGSPLDGGSLILPSAGVASGGAVTTFPVNGSGSGQLYLGQGFYWLILATYNSSSSLSWNYLNQTAAPNASMPIALHGSVVRVNPQSTWNLQTTAFRFNVSGCHLTGIPSASPSLSASPVPSASPSLSASPMPSRSPPSGFEVTPLVANVSTSFDSSVASAVNISAPLSSSGAEVAVSSQFTGLVIGNNSLPAASLTEFSRTVRETEDDSEEALTTYVYAAQVDEAARLEQAFTFHSTKASGQFAGTSFDIGAGSVKWSVNITSTNASTFADGVTIKYRLSGLLGSAPNVNSSGSSQPSSVVRRARNTPQAGMTTYFLAFAADPSDPRKLAGCAVEVFDAALVDGAEAAVPIEHDVQVGSQAEFELVLRFPAFEQSLLYDPSLNLGVLLGGGGRDELDGGSSGGGDNLGMIVAVAVAIPVAVVVVLVVIVVGTALIMRRKKLARAKFTKSALVGQTV